MFRNAVLIFVITLVLPMITAYGAMTIPAGPLTILPEDCQLAVDGEIVLTLDGFIPRNAVATWDVDQGGISSVLPGSSAVLVAPKGPTVITVSVTITPALPGLSTPITRQCTVTPLNSGPNGLAGAIR